MQAQISGGKENSISSRRQIVAMMTRTEISIKESVEKSRYELTTT